MDQTRLSEGEAKKLLDRASELDAERSQTLDPAAVRAIALEAGISPEAIDAAVAEHLEGRAGSAPTISGRVGRRFMRLASGVGLLVFGLVLLSLLSRFLFP